MNGAVNIVYKLKTIETQKYFKYEFEPGFVSDNVFSDRLPVSMIFTTRRGGVSEGIYSALNMGYSTGDIKDNIYANRSSVLKDFGLTIKDMASSDQVHGAVLKKVTGASEDAGECDGIFTSAKNVVLSMFFADCTPLFFYDPYNGVAGLSHAGWRGTVADIASGSVEFMAGVFGSAPDSILAVIGPSIGQCCFETGPEVADEFYMKLSKINVDKFIKPPEIPDGRFYIDLKGVNRALLENAGIKKENIFSHEICTFCAKDLFYSYRRDCGDTGRMAALAFIK